MADEGAIVISAAVEGAVDEAVLRCLADVSGIALGAVYGKKGKKALLQGIRGYNEAARRHPWIVLVDLDTDAACAVPFCASWLPSPANGMCFRVAVHEVEAWLLADREQIAAFLGIAISRVPAQPELLQDPKATLISLAARSRRRDIREDIVPRAGSGRAVRPAYASRIIEFAHSHWRPAVAAELSDSLCRCLRCLQRLRSQRA